MGLNVLVIQLFIHDSDEGPVTKGPQAGAELPKKKLEERGKNGNYLGKLVRICQNAKDVHPLIRSQSELAQYFAGILEAMVANAVEI